MSRKQLVLLVLKQNGGPTMNTITRDVHRKLMDTLIVGSNSKKYKATFVKSFKSIKNVQDFRKSLSDMRKSYDHFVVDVLQSHRINIDGIYERLDEQWDQLFEKHKIDNILKAIAALVVGYAGGAILLSGQRVLKVKWFWREYKRAVLAIADEYAERCVADANKAE
jgi:hypothetical protein